MQTWFIEFFTQIGGLISPHLREVSLTAIASLLVIYGDTLNGLIKKQVRAFHFVVRTTIFVIVCAFGYGALTVFLSPLLAKQLVSVPLYILPVVILSIFIVIGVLAERKKHI